MDVRGKAETNASFSASTARNATKESSVSFPAAHDIKEQVRTQIDIVDLVGSYLELRRQGRRYVALCPWHDDSNPSLDVNPERQSWKCWTCNIGGDIFSFVMQREGVDFRQALEMLADRAGIEMRKGPAVVAGSANDKQALYKAVAWAEAQFHQYLLTDPNAEMARCYLEGRGITSESIQRFKIGFSPDQWQWTIDRARSAGMSEEILETVGLASRSTNGGRLYDFFKGRVIFPIRDPQNRAIAFGGRILPQFAEERAAKYKNSPETKLFSKSHQVYGLNVVRDQVSKKRHAIVVEGYTDAIAAYQHGVDNVVAVLGTALGEGHIRLLRRFADVVTLVLDGDEAGQRRTSEVLELFVQHQMDLRVVTLPSGLDPCDYLDQHGLQAFEACVTSASDALEHKIKIATAGIDLARDTHRANQALEEILKTLSRAPSKGLDAGQARLRQQQVIARLTREFRVDEQEIQARLRSLRSTTSKTFRRNESRREEDSFDRPGNTTRENQSSTLRVLTLDNWERAFFELLTRHPEITEQALGAIPRAEIRSAAASELFRCYEETCNRGQVPDFGRILTSLEDLGLKNLLVEVDESSQQKSYVDPATSLAELCDAFQRRVTERESRDIVSSLEGKQLSEEEELSFLTDLIEKKRREQESP